MAERGARGFKRLAILALVAAAHGGLLVLLIVNSRTQTIVVVTEPEVEITVFPPVSVPRIRTDTNPPKRVSQQLAVGLAVPALDTAAENGVSTTGDTRGSGVNWAAEARRAIRAFEIRRDRPDRSALSVSSVPEEWVPQGNHHPGDQFKLPNGDWMVWVNADCYQVAAGTASLPVIGTPQPVTTCLQNATTQASNE